MNSKISIIFRSFCLPASARSTSPSTFFLCFDLILRRSKTMSDLIFRNSSVRPYCSILSFYWMSDRSSLSRNFSTAFRTTFANPLCFFVINEQFTVHSFKACINVGFRCWPHLLLFSPLRYPNHPCKFISVGKQSALLTTMKQKNAFDLLM